MGNDRVSLTLANCGGDWLAALKKIYFQAGPENCIGRCPWLIKSCAG